MANAVRRILLQRIANYFLEWDGKDKTAPTMQLHIDELRAITSMHTELCRLEEENKRLKDNESVKGDLISRSALLREVSLEANFMPCGKDAAEMTLRKWIEKQPTAYNDGWIPCSERLPKDEELSQRKEVVVQNRCGEVFTAQYTYNCAHTQKKFFRDNCAVPYVIAWQPLPAPYQPKGE